MIDEIEMEVAILRAGYKKSKLAKRLGLSQVGFSRKLRNKSEFTASEIAKLTFLLHLTVEEQQMIFFKRQLNEIPPIECTES